VLLLPAFSSFLSLSISVCGFAVFGSVGFSSFTAPPEAGPWRAMMSIFYVVLIVCWALLIVGQVAGSSSLLARQRCTSAVFSGALGYTAALATAENDRHRLSLPAMVSCRLAAT
jgi:hypothetical protein